MIGFKTNKINLFLLSNINRNSYQLTIVNNGLFGNILINYLINSLSDLYCIINAINFIILYNKIKKHLKNML